MRIKWREETIQPKVQFWNQPWHDGDAEAFQANHGKLEPGSMIKFNYSQSKRRRGVPQ